MGTRCLIKPVVGFFFCFFCVFVSRSNVMSIWEDCRQVLFMIEMYVN